MLGFLLLQVATGLFSENKDDFAGPLSVLVSNETVRWMTGYHYNVGQWALIGLVVLHIAAIAYYALRGENLVAPMVTGDKLLGDPAPASRDDVGSRTRALALLAVCAAVIWGVVQLGG